MFRLDLVWKIYKKYKSYWSLCEKVKQILLIDKKILDKSFLGDYNISQLAEANREFYKETEMKTLKGAKIGSTVKVVKVHGEGPVRRRIMDMGITKGVEIYVRKLAPLGDPIELMVRGYELSLRKDDAEMIEVE